MGIMKTGENTRLKDSPHYPEGLKHVSDDHISAA
jgi:hypothetical protein